MQQGLDFLFVVDDDGHELALVKQKLHLHSQAVDYLGEVNVGDVGGESGRIVR